MQNRTYTTFSVIGSLLLAIVAVVAFDRVASAEPAKPTRIGYVRTAAPWLADVADGRFDEIAGRTIRWKSFRTSAEVALALDAGSIDAGLMSSGAIAATISRGLPIRLIWIANVVNARHVVIFRDGTGIDRTRPVSMAGRKIGVTFLSAAHEALLVALASNGLSIQDVRLVNLAPGDMEAAWKSGRVDAVCLGGTRTAAILAAIAGERVLLEPSASPPFHALVASRDYLEHNSETAALLVAALARAGEENSSTAARSRTASSSRSRPARDREDESPTDPAQFYFPSLAEQAGPNWLGGSKTSGVASRLAAVSDIVSPIKRGRRQAVDFLPYIAADIVVQAAPSSTQR